jgi:hypothetical protein
MSFADYAADIAELRADLHARSARADTYSATLRKALRSLRRQKVAARDALASLALGAGLPPVDSPTFFAELAAVPPRSLHPDGFAHASSTFGPALSTLTTGLAALGPRQRGPETFYAFDPATKTVTATQYVPDVPAELELAVGVIDESLPVPESTCRVLETLGVAQLHRPEHMLYAVQSPDGTVTVNDPNESSLQEAERTLLMLGDPTHTLFPDSGPGGWCQTWSWFAIECAIMGVPNLHDTLARYFTDPDAGRWQVAPDPSAPPIVTEMAALSAADAPRVGVGAAVATPAGPGRVVKILGSVYEVVTNTGFVTVDASDLTVTGPGGFGLALTSLVLRLAARYERLCSAPPPTAAVVAAARARPRRALPSPGSPGNAPVSESLTAIMQQRGTVPVRTVSYTA